ncbi:MAG: hypothetical protein ACYS80_20350, partial [Planctomycetota bacterium]
MYSPGIALKLSFRYQPVQHWCDDLSNDCVCSCLSRQVTLQVLSEAHLRVGGGRHEKKGDETASSGGEGGAAHDSLLAESMSDLSVDGAGSRRRAGVYCGVYCGVLLRRLIRRPATASTTAAGPRRPPAFTVSSV